MIFRMSDFNIAKMAASPPETKPEDPGKDLKATGRFMVYVAWALALGLLTWGFSNVLDFQHNPNASPATSLGSDGEKVVVLRRNRLGHYVTAGRINGVPVEFLLDTGATNVSVPAAVAERLGLKRGAPRPVQTANGIITTYSTRLGSVKLGNIELTGVRASINPHSDSRSVLLGMSYLKHLELVQRGDTLTILQR